MSPLLRERLIWLAASTVLLSMVALAGFACRNDTVAGGEAALVWEAWDIVNSSYVEAGAVDSTRASANMITKMLEAGDRLADPFLAELESVRGRVPGGVPRDLASVWRAWTLFRRTWPDTDPTLLANAAVDGMLESLGDESVAHLSPEAYGSALENLNGTYEGIGAFVAIQDGKMVLSPMKDRPAERAGVRAGDVVLEVDGVPVEGRSLEEVTAYVKGPPGTKVTLRVERAGEEEPKEFEVIRGSIQVISIDRALFPGAIGYLLITDFLGHTGEEVLEALEELRQSDMLALILDLRGNPGGSIEAARKVAEQFLDEGLLMYEVGRDGRRTDWPLGGGDDVATRKLPLLLLVNRFTSEAAEALAGALQDAGRAKLLGTATPGKGSAHAYRELSDGSAIYLPVSHWYTPLGRPMHGVGIRPDIQVELMPEDISLGIDAQLRDAYDYLNDLLPHFR